MDKAAIIAELNNKYTAFADYVAALSEDDFVFSLNGEKWTAGQQVDHLCKSVEPLFKGLGAPEFALKAMFGTADHPSASYDELVARYQAELAAGGDAVEAVEGLVVEDDVPGLLVAAELQGAAALG